jgi:hypothetical protein
LFTLCPVWRRWKYLGRWGRKGHYSYRLRSKAVKWLSAWWPNYSDGLPRALRAEMVRRFGGNGQSGGQRSAEPYAPAGGGLHLFEGGFAWRPTAPLQRALGQSEEFQGVNDEIC